MTIVVILIPFAVISFDHQETNFLNAEISSLPIIEPSKIQEKQPETIQVSIDYQNQVKVLDLEDYLVGVVAAEMPASFHEEALKAQAVAARTYAYHSIIRNRTLKTTTADQAYIEEAAMRQKWGQDYNFYYAKIKKAVEDTAREIITYNGEPIKAFYFSMSNGYTEDSATVFQENYPYLQSVSSKWDETVRNFSYNYSFTNQELCNYLGLNCQQITFTNPIYTSTGYLLSIQANGETFTGSEIRQKLGLRSTAIYIDANNNITTEGFGHGVGMSQYGANGMASEGADYQEIIKYYYQNVEIQKI